MPLQLLSSPDLFALSLSLFPLLFGWPAIGIGVKAGRMNGIPNAKTKERERMRKTDKKKKKKKWRERERERVLLFIERERER